MKYLVIIIALLFINCNGHNENREQVDAEKDVFGEAKTKDDPVFKHSDTLVSDRQGNVYATIQFKDQLWATQNFQQTEFNNGDKIKEAKNASEWHQSTKNKEPVWCYYNFDSINKELYGVYYNWYAISDSRGLAPEGWGFPPNQQAQIFARELNFEAHQVKEREYWKAQRFDYNSTGFSARPGGFIGSDGEFRKGGDEAYFWTATEKNESNAMCFDLTDEFNSIHFSDLTKALGMNTRLFKLIEQ